MLQGKLHRSAVGSILDRSPGAVTKHVRMLLDHGILESTPVRVSHAKRPMDELALRPAAATGLAVLLNSRQVSGELIGLDLKPFYRSELEIARPTQEDILGTLSRLVATARTAAREFNRPIDFLGIGVEGLVLPGPALIFSMHGVAPWDPCQPKDILEPLTAIRNTNTWASVECKLLGFSRSIQEDDRVAYLEVYNDHIALSTLRNGQVALGEHGTSSQYLHTRVSQSPERCFCGRTGCFHHHLRSGRITGRVMRDGLRRVFEQVCARRTAIELRSSPFVPAAPFPASPELEIVSDGEPYAREGVRVLTALSCARILLYRALNA